MIPQGPFRTEKQVKWYAAAVRERDEARAEVERLTNWNQLIAVCREHTDLIVLGDNLPNGCYVCEAMERNIETADVLERIAAERQQIASAVRQCCGSILLAVSITGPCGECEACLLADRIASGGFATEEVPNA